MCKFKVGDYITRSTINHDGIIWKIYSITRHNYHTVFVTSKFDYYPLGNGYTWNHYMSHTDIHFRKLSDAEVLAKVL